MFLKVDIEGAEYGVLDALYADGHLWKRGRQTTAQTTNGTSAGIDLITIEWHPKKKPWLWPATPRAALGPAAWQ